MAADICRVSEREARWMGWSTKNNNRGWESCPFQLQKQTLELPELEHDLLFCLLVLRIRLFNLVTRSFSQSQESLLLLLLVASVQHVSQ